MGGMAWHWMCPAVLESLRPPHAPRVQGRGLRAGDPRLSPPSGGFGCGVVCPAVFGMWVGGSVEGGRGGGSGAVVWVGAECLSHAAPPALMGVAFGRPPTVRVGGLMMCEMVTQGLGSGSLSATPEWGAAVFGLVVLVDLPRGRTSLVCAWGGGWHKALVLVCWRRLLASRHCFRVLSWGGLGVWSLVRLFPHEVCGLGGLEQHQQTTRTRAQASRPF